MLSTTNDSDSDGPSPDVNIEIIYEFNKTNSDDDDDDNDNGGGGGDGNNYNDKINEYKEMVEVRQYAKSVVDFSSQYGSEFSISYTANNITGRESKFPSYGDFPETFAMRTYGPWWDIAPSKPPDIMPQSYPDIISQDFIVIEFEEYVYPQNLCIFETYNPGGIIQIWAFGINNEWKLIWLGESLKTGAVVRAFGPKLLKYDVPTRIIRLDFNHTHLNYYTEIDAVLLIGLKYTPSPLDSLNCKYNKPGPIQKKLEITNFQLRPVSNYDIDNFLVNELDVFLSKEPSAKILNTTTVKSITKNKTNALSTELNNFQFNLQDFPYEILFKICSYLDLISLFRLSATCRTLNNVCHDPILYKEINLKHYWHLVDSKMLSTLAKRCNLLKKCDMSWCGLFTQVNDKDFKLFISECGQQLTSLRLDSVRFLNVSCIQHVSIECSNLTELSLRNFRAASAFTAESLAPLRQLERLDLFRSSIDSNILLMILANNSNLKYLNLGFFDISSNMDEIALQISKCNRKIISIDMWKSHNLSSIGLMCLADCIHLEELDLGWCLRDEALPGESIRAIVSQCKKLIKLCLASIRGLGDRDFEYIAKHCANLEQLDLMGVMGISTDKCLELLTKCTKLKLLDLSFCENLDGRQIIAWRDIFRIDIKHGTG